MAGGQRQERWALRRTVFFEIQYVGAPVTDESVASMKLEALICDDRWAP